MNPVASSGGQEAISTCLWTCFLHCKSVVCDLRDLLRFCYHYGYPDLHKQKPDPFEDEAEVVSGGGQDNMIDSVRGLFSMHS